MYLIPIMLGCLATGAVLGWFLCLEFYPWFRK